VHTSYHSTSWPSSNIDRPETTPTVENVVVNIVVEHLSVGSTPGSPNERGREQQRRGGSAKNVERNSGVEREEYGLRIYVVVQVQVAQ